MSDVGLTAEQAKKLLHTNLDSYNEFGLREVAGAIVDYLLTVTHESWASVDMSEIVSIVMNGGRSE